MRTAVCLLIVAAGIVAAFQTAAIADSRRQTMDFGWKFLLGDPAGAQAADFNDSAWTAIDLPHDWSIAGPFDQNAPATGAGAYLPTGIGWYRKTFQVSDSLKDRKIAIEFDGVYENSEVWINGTSVGKRPFGYISFVYDLTPYLHFGNGNNVLAVRADNSVQPNSRWYSGSGIDRHTWLLTTDGLHIPQWGTYVTTPRADANGATVQAAVDVDNQRDAAAQFTLICTLLDSAGRQVGQVQGDHALKPAGDSEFTQQIQLDKPNLWSVDTPYLYTLRSELSENGKVIDSYDTPIGIRSIDFDVNRGFLLNGVHVKLNGVCLHEDGGSVGAAVPEGVWARRMKILREMGCNAIRTSHNPPTPEFLDLCDQLGFLVMDESFDVWRSGKGQAPRGYNLFFDQWWKRDVTDFVRRDRNHPSVVLWSAGNEINEQVRPDGVEILKNLVDVFHAEDPTRPVTAACDKAYAEPQSAPPEFMALLDVAGYNYVDRWRDRADKYYSIDREKFPLRKFIGTESSSMGSVRGDYRSLFPTAAPATAPVAAGPIGAGPGRGRGFGGFGGGFGGGGGQRINVEGLWKFVGTYDYVAGDFMWTGIDYLGEAFWPGKSSSSGVLDTCGFKKDGFYFYQSQWTTQPVLHVFPHWNFAGKEGQIIPVTCFTNCDTVELFLNGKSMGVKGYNFPREGMEGRYGNQPARSRAVRTTGDLHLSWDVAYEPGTLKAVGTSGGKVVATDTVETTGEAAGITLSADNTTPAADGRDVAQITVEVVDAQGRMVPTADEDITFDLSGPGKIIGVDNGNPVSHESFQANHRKAFNGMCLVIVQTTRTAGPMRLTARAEKMPPAEVDINSRPAAVSDTHP
jgi:beta-galactosidase